MVEVFVVVVVVVVVVNVRVGVGPSRAAEGAIVSGGQHVPVVEFSCRGR